VKSNARRAPTNHLGKAMPHLAVGDLVRTGEDFHPEFHVIAVTEDRAWIGNTQPGTDHIIPIDRCRRI